MKDNWASAYHAARVLPWSVTFPSHSASFDSGSGWTADGRNDSAWIHLNLPSPITRPEGMKLAGLDTGTQKVASMAFGNWDDLLAWAKANGAPTTYAPAKGTRNAVWLPAEKGELPCMVQTSTNERWPSYSLCGGRQKEDGKCGRHLAHSKRKAEKERKWREEWDRSKSNDKASEDWAERLREEFGIDAQPGYSRNGISVVIGPEQLYAKLSEVRGLLNEVYGDDHPFAGQR